MTPTSHTLLETIKNNPDSPEWARFYRLYHPLLEGWAVKNGIPPADAEVLAQDVMGELVRALGKYTKTDGATFRSWLFTVARNTASRKHTRKATRRLPGADGLSGVADDDNPLADMEKAEYERELITRAVDVARSDFGEQTVAAFIGTKIDGRPAGEVAAELGVTVNVVYVAVNRVMTRLRHELAGLLD